MVRARLPFGFLLVAACISPQFEVWQDEHESMQDTGAGSGPTEGSGPGSVDSSGTSTSASDSSTADSVTTDTGASTGDSGESAGDAGSTGETDSIPGLPIDPPPTVENLVCDPEKSEEIGPITCTYDSVGATVAELLDDGQVVATGPAGDPLIFPVTSAPTTTPAP